jgi:hypothetical protein
VTDAPKNQEDKILWALQASWPNWVPAPELAKIALQYCRVICHLRHKRGWVISNRVEVVDGVRHGFYRLGERPTPSSKELRRRASPSPAATLPPIGGRVTRLQQNQGLSQLAPIGANSTAAQPGLFGDLKPETARHRDDG